MRILIVALISLFISFSTDLSAEDLPNHTSLFVSTDNGHVVSPVALDAALSRSSVIGRLAPGEAAQFLGVSVESSSDSMVLLGASADLVYAACLKGSIHAGGIEAGPGQLILWQPGGEAPESLDFDMRRYLASSSLRFNETLQEEFDLTAQAQEQQMFWGLLQPTNTNVQSLSAPVMEQMRREYLRRPAIIQLRLKNQTADALARGVAETFVAALANGDITTITDLLNPTLFVAEGKDLAASNWRRVRKVFATGLVGQQWSAEIEPASIEATDDIAVWQVKGGSTDYLISLGGFDGMTFVNSVRPAPGQRLAMGETS